ncbi:MAG: TonB-dependent receptor [Muribaculaceae bacterium]|nr:TonB-dependent receptor [Muribaculaceae bacterium]
MSRPLRPLEVLGVKQMPDGGTTIGALTELRSAQINRLSIEAAKDISIVAPNFYMPDYGSRMTSSIYVRGLGARIDQPVVGLTVDNIPYINKDNFDFDIADIQNIEVLRGAQSVLNGRNTMAGQITIRTLSPLRTQGFRAKAEYASGQSAMFSAGYYGRIRPDLGMSITGQYRHEGGFWDNEYSGEKVGRENSGSARWKTEWRPTPSLSLSNVAVGSFNKQAGYAYENTESGKIEYNDTCSYRRTSIADALTVAWAGKRVVVTSITSFQYLNDCMVLDQDFLPADYFTLTQRRNEWALTEDLFTRGSRGKYSWLGGVYGFHRSTGMDAPVTFKDTGIARLIEDHRNDVNPDYPIRWDSRRFVLGSHFDMHSSGGAFYHESTVHLGDWRLEAGLRLDIERTSLSYHSSTHTGYTTMHILPDGTEEVFSHQPVDINDKGHISHTYIELLPKFTVSYSCPLQPYFTFSKGYKAGGYNTQMFSDVLQQRIMSIMGMSSLYEFGDVVSYRPEKSFNYEVGFHWALPRNTFNLDGAFFFIDCRDQQLTIFPPGTTTGRMMTNAGRTRSLGAELSTQWSPVEDVTLRASYGYTNATFRKYYDGRTDYRGKQLPYAPSHTLFGEATWHASRLSFSGIVPSLTATARCAGRIWWDEDNTISQPFYCLAGLRLNFAAEHWSLALWAENLTDTRYNTFYFKSIGNTFVQRGNPRKFGATLRLIL